MNRIISVVMLTFLLLSGTFVSAHELVPTAIQQYVEENPTATAEEIRAFAATIDAEEVVSVIPLAPQSTSNFVYTYIELGVEHILIGLDHILFIIAMLLVATTVRMILQRTIVFTIAHSLTFILAGTTTLALSAQIVEPIIAFSIAAVALLSLRPSSERPYRDLVVIFILGLFHGLGFAGLLTDLKMPSEYFLGALVLFNVGIELGQLAVIAIAYPLLHRFQIRPYWEYLHIALASTLSVIGVWWGVSRILF